MVDNSEIQYSKVGSKQDVERFKKFIGKTNDLLEKSEGFTDEEIIERLKYCK